MKLTLSAKALAAQLKAVIPAVATRPGLPILSGARLEASVDGRARRMLAWFAGGCSSTGDAARAEC